MYLKALLFWFLLMVLAILNGTVRLKLIIPFTGLTAGLANSTVMLCALILGATWLGIGWIGPSDAKQAWSIGLFWLAMTLAFELGAGHYLFKKLWPELLPDHDLTKGRIWVLVPIVAALAPWWMAKVRWATRPGPQHRPSRHGKSRPGRAPRQPVGAACRSAEGRIGHHA